ncbi:MAG: FecR domain-containing protein [Pseudomonadota bacterium]
MPPESEPHFTQNTIDTEAHELVAAYNREPTRQSSNAIDSFKSLSDRHAQAINKAQQLLRAGGKVSSYKLSRWQQLRRKGEIIATKLVEGQLSYVLGAVAIVSMSLYLSYSAFDGSQTPATPSAQTYASVHEYITSWQEQKELTLADGSKVWMSWNTQLTVAFSERERKIIFSKGLAAFDVVSDPSRSFVVVSDDIETTVVGTEFVVNRQTSDSVRVSVMHGEVVVRNAYYGTAILTAAQTVIARQGKLTPVETRPAQDIGQWRRGKLVFTERPLLEVIEALAPYTPFKVDSSELIEHSGEVTGIFYIDEAADALFTIAQAHRLESRWTGSQQLHLSPSI